MKSKTTPWTNIKIDYLQGVLPKDLAEKYDVDINKVYKKIENGKWAAELREIKGNIGNEVQEEIKDLTKLALGELKCVLSDSEADYKDKIAAARAVLDVSGLKSSKQEIEASGFSVVINNKARDVKRD